ncbi:MAG: hypothetical protein ACOY0S_04570 [Patescibacteria group bacterium]
MNKILNRVADYLKAESEEMWTPRWEYFLKYVIVAPLFLVGIVGLLCFSLPMTLLSLSFPNAASEVWRAWWPLGLMFAAGTLIFVIEGIKYRKD